MKNNEYFTKFPNNYIQSDIVKQLGVSRKFYITYLLIDKYRSYEDFSWITIKKIFDFYGYQTGSHKPKSFYEILDVLEYMINNRMIEVMQPLDSLNYDSGIEIKIIPENFDSKEKFTMLSTSELNNIMMAESSINKENLLLAYLYISSYIGCRSEYIAYDPSKNPNAFFKSLDSMSRDISMSKKTIIECIDYLTSRDKDRDALLIKEETGTYIDSKTKKIKKYPNIYVKNEPGYKDEIKWALDKMVEVYKSDINNSDKLKNKNKK